MAMNDDQWRSIIDRLNGTWPEAHLSNMVADVYRQSLGAADPNALHAAIGHLAGTQPARLPSPDDILRAVAAGTGTTPSVVPVPPVVPAAAAVEPVPAGPPPSTADPSKGPAPVFTLLPGSRAKLSRPVIMTSLTAMATLITTLFAWASTPFGDIAGNNTDDGKFVLMLGLLGAGTIWISTYRKTHGITNIVLASLALLVIIGNIVDIEQRASSAGLSGSVSAGIGLLLGAVTAVVWFGMAIWALRDTASDPVKEADTAKASSPPLG